MKLWLQGVQDVSCIMQGLAGILKKEDALGVFNKKISIPLILILLLVLVEAWVYLRLEPNFSTPTGKKIALGLFVANVLAFLLIFEPWRSHPNCSLFFSEGNRHVYDMAGNYVRTVMEKTSCSRKSVGKVRTAEGKWECFCKRHHPTESRIGYWLTTKGIGLNLATLKMFRFVEEDGSDSAGPQAGPPRIDFRLP